MSKRDNRGNRLSQEKSPYLLQHAHNPVDWYAWGEEAFAKARSEDKPIFLSVGYSTCHWCHVMERESFADPEIAALMNERYINIKVDREERPDVDRVYMTFVQATTGQGGWPMSVWLTPELEPFFGGTYFPPDRRYGRAGLPDLLQQLADVWQGERDGVKADATRIVARLREEMTLGKSESDLDHRVLDEAYRQFERSYDVEEGGFGSAPKFPRPATFNFLLRYGKERGLQAPQQMTVHTLKAMGDGGIFDHLGGGFHRYSVDRQWHVPHFEKMLYDQAQLLHSYLEGYQISADRLLASRAQSIADYVLRDLCDAQSGAFYSAEDADSLAPGREEKTEGAFYVFSFAEVQQALSSLGANEANFFCAYFGCTEPGNALDPQGELKGKNVLHIQGDRAEISAQFDLDPIAAERVIKKGKALLLTHRDQRARPHLDDKVITAWNGMMIGALAKAGTVLKDPRYLNAAERAAGFALDVLYVDGELHRRYRDGETAFSGNLEDYAQLVSGLFSLYQANCGLRWLRAASHLAEEMIARFFDDKEGGFFSTTGNDPSVLLRIKEDYDGAEPSGNAVAVASLLRLGSLLDRADFVGPAKSALRAFAARLNRMPQAMPEMLVAHLLCQRPMLQVVVVGEADEAKDLLDVIRRDFAPDRLVLLLDAEARAYLAKGLPHLLAMNKHDDLPTAYLCHGFQCEAPITDPLALLEKLGQASPASS